MPWRESDVLDLRTRFIFDQQRGLYTMAELCRSYAISRETGYKWVERYEQGGLLALPDRSRAPLNHPNQMGARVVQQLLELRRAHPRWGPKKLRGYLAEKQPRTGWPAHSTIGELLRREGLASARRTRRKVSPYTQPFSAVEEPNQVWCVDFKGWFRTGDGERIDPLTMTDAHSRYLLRCQAVEKSNTAQVAGVLEAAFREYGMPLAMLSDNGAPFASRAIAGISRLQLYLMKLGIRPERIAAGHPEQNGRHERMHRRLKAETAQPPAAHRRAQQRAFDRFREEYNQERPHEALGQHPPGQCYRESPRAYPARLPQPEYPGGMEVRRVQKHGEFRWGGEAVFISEALAGEAIGLEAMEEGYWQIYFARFPLGRFNSVKGRVEPLGKNDKNRKLGRAG